MSTDLRNLSPIELDMQERHGGITSVMLMQELNEALAASRIDATRAYTARLLIESAELLRAKQSPEQPNLDVYSVQAIRRYMALRGA